MHARGGGMASLSHGSWNLWQSCRYTGMTKTGVLHSKLWLVNLVEVSHFITVQKSENLIHFESEHAPQNFVAFYSFEDR